MLTPAPPIVIHDDANSTPARHAFTRSTPEGTWSSFPIVLVPSADGPLDGALASELDVAARAWRAVSCARVDVRIATPRAVAPGDDGVLAVVWQTVQWPAELVAGAPAQTVLHVDANGHFRDADVFLNAVDFAWSIGGDSARAQPGAVDLRGVLTHELGHVFGLGHSADPKATMFASIGDAAAWRSLEADDAAGLCFLYPGTGTPACGDAVHCPAPFVCVSARCERPRDPRAMCAPCNPNDPAACSAEGEDARCVGSAASSAGGLAFRCGRPCVTTDECGAGFHCEATTQAGDRQCVGGCASGPHRCAPSAAATEMNAECTDGATCIDGSCAEVVRAADAGADAAESDSGPMAAALESGGGCAIAPSWPARAAARVGDWSRWLSLALALAVAAFRRTRSGPSSALPASCRAPR